MKITFGFLMMGFGIFLLDVSLYHIPSMNNIPQAVSGTLVLIAGFFLVARTFYYEILENNPEALHK